MPHDSFHCSCNDCLLKWNRLDGCRFRRLNRTWTARIIPFQLCVCYRTFLPCTILRVGGPENCICRRVRLLRNFFHRIGAWQEHRYHPRNAYTFWAIRLRWNYSCGRHFQRYLPPWRTCRAYGMLFVCCDSGDCRRAYLRWVHRRDDWMEMDRRNPRSGKYTFAFNHFGFTTRKKRWCDSSQASEKSSSCDRRWEIQSEDGSRSQRHQGNASQLVHQSCSYVSHRTSRLRLRFFMDRLRLVRHLPLPFRYPDYLLREERGWNEGVAGLPYISLCIGVTIGFTANFLQIRKYKSILAARDRKILPESRLYGVMWGSAFLPVGLFIYSFTQYGYLPWIAPTIALAPIAIGIFFIFESTYSFTSDCYGENSSSAIAGQGLMRNTLGGVAPLFASQFFHNVGSQYAGLILALAGTMLTFIPFVMFKFGHKLRERSKLANSQLGGDEQKDKTGLYAAPFIRIGAIFRRRWGVYQSYQWYILHVDSWIQI